MREHKTILIINGVDSEIFYRKSRAKKPKSFNLYTIEMLNIIEALLIGADSPFMYPKGITTLSNITSWDEKKLSVKRLSNKVIRLRSELPQSCLLTYKPLGKKEEWRYSIIKTAENIKSAKALRDRLIRAIESKDIKLSKAYEDNRKN